MRHTGLAQRVSLQSSEASVRLRATETARELRPCWARAAESVPALDPRFQGLAGLEVLSVSHTGLTDLSCNVSERTSAGGPGGLRKRSERCHHTDRVLEPHHKGFEWLQTQLPMLFCTFKEMEDAPPSLSLSLSLVALEPEVGATAEGHRLLDDGAAGAEGRCQPEKIRSNEHMFDQVTWSFKGVLSFSTVDALHRLCAVHFWNWGLSNMPLPFGPTAASAQEQKGDRMGFLHSFPHFWCSTCDAPSDQGVQIVDGQRIRTPLGAGAGDRFPSKPLTRTVSQLA